MHTQAGASHADRPQVWIVGFPDAPGELRDLLSSVDAWMCLTTTVEQVNAGLRPLSPSCVVYDASARLEATSTADITTQPEVTPPVVMVTAPECVVPSSLPEGVSSVIERPVRPSELLSDVWAAIRLDEVRCQRAMRRSIARARLASLTDRELEVLGAVVTGKPSKSIAHDLGLSPRTVEVHRSHLMRKTGCESVSELTLLAVKSGLLES